MFRNRVKGSRLRFYERFSYTGSLGIESVFFATLGECLFASLRIAHVILPFIQSHLQIFSLFSTGIEHAATADGVGIDYDSENSDCESVGSYSSGEFEFYELFLRHARIFSSFESEWENVTKSLTNPQT